MKHLSVRATFVGIGLATLIITGIMTAIGITDVMLLGDRLVQGDEASAAVRHHLEADMMHDALRGDVYAALLAADLGGGAMRADVEGALKEHTANFREAIAANVEADLPADVVKLLADARGPLDAYILSAQNLVALAFTDRAAAVRGLPAFNQVFVRLEGVMSDISEKLQA